MGYYVKDLKPGQPEFGKAFRCRCRTENDTSRRLRYLLSIDGLTDDERRYRFDNTMKSKTISPALDAVKETLFRRRGIVTLSGAPGVGKSRLLICAVNEARDVNLPAVYTTVTDLLEYLRRAYSPQKDEPDFDGRWDLLVKADVLALDELDEFNTTPWAMEKFLRLIDERWRSINDRVTIVATNANLNTLPEKVASRLRDGRAQVVTMKGADNRPAQKVVPT